MATHKKLQTSIHLSGKTSQIVHRMLQDMMLGTVEKSRVQEFREAQIAKARPMNKAKKVSLMELFLREKLADMKKDKFDDDEEDLRNNPHKYDIYEERDIVTASDGASSARQVLKVQNPDATTAAVKTKAKPSGDIDLNEESQSNSIGDLPPDKMDSAAKLCGYYHTKKAPEPTAYDEYCNTEDEFYPSILNECIELNLLLLEKVYNTFKKKAEKVVNNFRKDNFNHLKPKLLEVLERPPDEFLNRNKKRKNIDEGTVEINDETVLIGKNDNIEETYDAAEDNVNESYFHQSDNNLANRIRQQIDKNGELVGDDYEGMDAEEMRRQALLMDLMNSRSSRNDKSGSINSHATSSIPDSRGINFQEPNLAMIDNNSDEDSMDEQDIVYYHKDDLTQFSKNLGLNKVRRKQDELKLSEEDYSDDTSNNGSRLIGDPLFRSAISEIGDEGDASLFAGVSAGHGDGAMAGFNASDGFGGPGGPGGFYGPGGIGSPGGISGAGALGTMGAMGAMGAFGSDGTGRGRGKGGFGSDGDEDGFMGTVDVNGKRKRSKKSKGKKKPLTNAQKSKLRKMNEIYGQDAEELGLSPRDKRYQDGKGVNGRKKITKKGGLDGNMSALTPGYPGSGLGGRDGRGDRNSRGGRNGDFDGVDGSRNGSKSRSRSKNKKKVRKVGTSNEVNERMRRFNELNLNRSNIPEGEYDALKRKLQKFRKRKDLSFWMDYDSPYAEYLPHRFREWVPETKTGLNLDTNPQHLHAQDKAHELSRIYSRGLAPGEIEDRDNNMSHAGSK